MKVCIHCVKSVAERLLSMTVEIHPILGAHLKLGHTICTTKCINGSICGFGLTTFKMANRIDKRLACSIELARYFSVIKITFNYGDNVGKNAGVPI